MFIGIFHFGLANNLAAKFQNFPGILKIGTIEIYIFQ